MEAPVFTKEIKDKWITALKSGNFTQVQGRYKSIDYKRHCCIAVLAETVFKPDDSNLVWQTLTTIPYDSDRGNNNGYALKNRLVEINDAESDDFKPDYSNVIPFIETLSTVD